MACMVVELVFECTSLLLYQFGLLFRIFILEILVYLLEILFPLTICLRMILKFLMLSVLFAVC